MLYQITFYEVLEDIASFKTIPNLLLGPIRCFILEIQKHPFSIILSISLFARNAQARRSVDSKGLK